MWRSLARLVRHGPVEMAISIAVGMFAAIQDIQDISFALVRMAVAWTLITAVSPCTVTCNLRMARFAGVANQPESMFSRS